MKPIGTIGIIIAVVLSLFAVAPNLGRAQSTSQAPAAAETKATTVTETKGDTETKTTTAATTAAEDKPTPGADGPTFPAIPFLDFKGTGTVKEGDPNVLLTTGSFAWCVEKQFGIRFQLLPAAAQSQILKDYARYAVPEANCIQNAASPSVVNPFVYGTTLVVGAILLIGFFISVPIARGFLNETVPLPAPQLPPVPPLDAASIQFIMQGVLDRAAQKNYTPAEFIAATEAVLNKVTIKAPPVYAYKFSVSRLIALLGTYVIIVTFAFAAKYGYWALTLGDNSIFEKITTTILLGGAAAFAPYVVNKVADAVSSAGK